MVRAIVPQEICNRYAYLLGCNGADQLRHGTAEYFNRGIAMSKKTLGRGETESLLGGGDPVLTATGICDNCDLSKEQISTTIRIPKDGERETVADAAARRYQDLERKLEQAWSEDR